MPRFQIPRAAFLGALALVIFVLTFGVLLSLTSTQPLTHDEAVYLAKARSWIDGSPANQWGVYRPIGMSFFGWAWLQFDSHETWVRGFGVVAGALTAVLVFVYFSLLANVWVGAAAAALLVSSPLFLRDSNYFFNDVPSAGMALALMLVVYIFFSDGGRSRWIYAAGPLVALAFYTRYGIVMGLALIALFTYLLLIPRLVEREKTEAVDFKKLGISILIAIGLLVPHVIHSIVTTKSILGILTTGGEAAGRAYIGQGLVTYLQWIVDAGIGGRLLDTLAVAGTVFTLAIFLLPSVRREFTAVFWTGMIGISTFVVTGLLVHAEARYVIFPLILLSGVGIAGLHAAIARVSLPTAHAAALCVAILACLVGARSHSEVRSFFVQREQVPATLAYSEAHAAINADAGTSPCAVWLAQFLPRASWYTGCSVYRVENPEKFERESTPHTRRYSLVFTRLREAQIAEADAGKYGVTLVEIFRKRDIPGDMIVYRIEQPSAGTATSSSP